MIGADRKWLIFCYGKSPALTAISARTAVTTHEYGGMRHGMTTLVDIYMAWAALAMLLAGSDMSGCLQALHLWRGEQITPRPVRAKNGRQEWPESCQA